MSSCSDIDFTYQHMKGKTPHMFAGWTSVNTAKAAAVRIVNENIGFNSFQGILNNLEYP